MTKLYPVRCCCQPKTLLGHLEGPDQLKHRDRFAIIEEPKWHPPLLGSPTGSVTTYIHQAEVRQWTADGLNFELAVYSEDRPIEFWRKIKGFIEA